MCALRCARPRSSFLWPLSTQRQLHTLDEPTELYVAALELAGASPSSSSSSPPLGVAVGSLHPRTSGDDSGDDSGGDGGDDRRALSEPEDAGEAVRDRSSRGGGAGGGGSGGYGSGHRSAGRPAAAVTVAVAMPESAVPASTAVAYAVAAPAAVIRQQDV